MIELEYLCFPILNDPSNDHQWLIILTNNEKKYHIMGFLTEKHSTYEIELSRIN